MIDMPGPGKEDSRRPKVTAPSDSERERVAAIIRRPRIAALISGSVVVIAVAVDLFWLDRTSGLLLGAIVIAGLVCVVALWNVINFSWRAVTRLRSLAPKVGGRFTLWAGGSGGHGGGQFTSGVAHQRFGVLKFSENGAQVEIGHFASEVAVRQTSPMGRSIGYVAVRLPERLPNIFLRGGRHAQVLGMRWTPEPWHRSQRIDVGAGRRFRVFVGDGGEQIARAFFDPDLVQVLRRVSRQYDVEIKDRTLYLYAARSVASGTERRWRAQLPMIAELVTSMSSSAVWDLVRRQSRGRGPAYGDLRVNGTRLAVMIGGAGVVAVVVLSFLALWGAGLLA